MANSDAQQQLEQLRARELELKKRQEQERRALREQKLRQTAALEHEAQLREGRPLHKPGVDIALSTELHKDPYNQDGFEAYAPGDSDESDDALF